MNGFTMQNLSEQSGANTAPRSVNPRSKVRDALSLCFALLGLALVACGGEEDRLPPSLGLEGGGRGGGGQLEVPCTAGETQSCSETLSQASGVLSCYHGTRECIGDGVWGPCENGTVVTQVDPTDRLKKEAEGTLQRPGPTTLALSAVKDCVGNPCDPHCQYWAEDPSDITNDSTTTPGTAPGPFPDWSTTTTTCAHQPCSVNTPALDSTCHPCIQKVCSDPALAYCCSNASATAWDQKCVEGVYAKCSVVPPVVPQICGFTVLGDSSVNLANATTFPSSVGTHGTLTMASGVTGKNLISDKDITIANAANFDTIYTTGTVTTQSGLTVKDVYAKTGVVIRNAAKMQNVVTDGDFSSPDSGWTVTGSLTAKGNCTLTNSSTIAGQINCGGNFTIGSAGLATNSTVYVGGNVTDSWNANLPVSIHAGGSISLTSWAGAITGNLFAEGAVNFTGGSNTITGLIHSGNNLGCTGGGTNATSGKSYFSGVKTGAGTCNFPAGVAYSSATPPRIKPTAPTIPTFPSPPATLPTVSAYARNTTTACTAAAAAAALTVPGGGGTRTVTPGSINGVTYVNNGGTLILNGGGSYVFQNVDMASSATLKFLGTGPWDITVCSTFNLRNSSNMVDSTGTAQVAGKLVTIYSAATSGTCIQSESSTKLSGVLIAPFCTINVQNGTTAQVLMWGKDVTMGSGVTYQSISQAECEAVDHTNGNGGPTNVITTGACPVVTSTSKLDYDPGTCESARDCQTNRRCENVSTDVSCAHSKCVVGAALTNAACRTDDKCVDVICTADSSCCSSSSFWTQSCVDKVATLCSSSCGPITKSLCEHDACTQGVALSRTCSADVKYVCDNVSASCCDGTAANSWDSACIAAYTQKVTGAPYSTGPAAGNSLCDYAVSNGSGALNLNSTKVTGNIIAAAGAINGSGAITGNSYTQTAYADSHSGIQAGYSKLKFATVPYTVPAWSDVDSANCPGVTSTAETWTTAKAAGSYGYVNVTGDITLPNGGGPTTTVNYYVGQFDLANGKTLTLPTDGTKVNLFVCSSYFFVRDNAKILSPTVDPTQLMVWVKGSNINFGSGSTSTGAFSILTGSGTLTMTGNAKVTGMIHNVNGGLTGDWGTVVDASGVSRSTCLARGIDPKGKPNLCPASSFAWSASTVGGTPTCTSNLTGSVLNQRSATACAEADLTLGEPCDNKIPVCNRGNKDLAAGQAEISFYDRQSLEFATSSPSSLWKDTTVCNVGVAVPKGKCVDVTCPVFTADKTAYLTMKTSATQTECSGLDNWTYYPFDRACTTGSVTTVTQKVVINDYVATCTEQGTAPVWGFLGWDTNLAGAATVDFDVALSTDNGSTYGAYQAVATAATVSSNAHCPLASSCVVDVGSLLYPNGTRNQSTYLRLRATLNPDGLNKATLAAWDLSYSCVFDE